MQELIDHIQSKQCFEIYRTATGGLDGFDNAMGIMYSFISQAARSGADTIIIGDDELTWLKNNRVLRREPFKEDWLGDSFRKAMKRIMGRDSLVTRFLQITSEDPNQHTYTFVLVNNE